MKPDIPVGPDGRPMLAVSNSEIQTFKRCHRKWYLTYFLEWGLKREESERTGARSLGTRVHLALQHWYESDVSPVETLDAAYEEAKAAFPNSAVELDKEAGLARAMVEGYVEWVAETGADEFLELVAAEATIITQSPVEGVLLRGKLDQRLVRSVDGVRLFLDHKTVGSLTEPVHMLPLDEQMKFYMLLEYLDALSKTGDAPPERTEGGLYNMLRKVKRTATARPPFYDRVEVRHNAATMQSMWKRVARVIEEIVEMRAALEAGGDHQYLAYPTPNRDCSWSCDFRQICPMMDDGSNWTGLLEEFYAHVDPHERYDTPEKTEGVV